MSVVLLSPLFPADFPPAPLGPNAGGTGLPGSATTKSITNLSPPNYHVYTIYFVFKDLRVLKWYEFEESCWIPSWRTLYKKKEKKQILEVLPDMPILGTSVTTVLNR